MNDDQQHPKRRASDFMNVEDKVLLANLASDLAYLKTSIQELKSAVTDLNHTVLGNGKPGLKTELQVLESRVGNISRILFWFGTTVGAIIIGYAASYFFRITP